MKLGFASGSAALALWLTLACGSTSACPLPQDGIAAARDSAGQIVFVNAGEFPPAAASPFRFSGALQPTAEIRRLIGQTASSLHVDPYLVDAVMRVESGYQPDARSPRGALGLMQLIPATAARFGVSNPFDPAENIRGGVTYLGELLKTFNGDVPLTLAAYNAGGGAVLRYGGIPPFEETQDYVHKVTALYKGSSSPGPASSVAPGGYLRAKTSPRPDESSRAAAGGAMALGAGRNNPLRTVPIYRYVDSEGKVHFAQ